LREFAADELLSEEPIGDKIPANAQSWRVVRARNKWQPNEDCAHDPVPGTPCRHHRRSGMGRLARAGRGI
jgi:hypothetical protein